MYFFSKKKEIKYKKKIKKYLKSIYFEKIYPE